MAGFPGSGDRGKIRRHDPFSAEFSPITARDIREIIRLECPPLVFTPSIPFSARILLYICIFGWRGFIRVAGWLDNKKEGGGIA